VSWHRSTFDEDIAVDWTRNNAKRLQDGVAAWEGAEPVDTVVGASGAPSSVKISLADPPEHLLRTFDPEFGAKL
jgi:hypothetical protein